MSDTDPTDGADPTGHRTDPTDDTEHGDDMSEIPTIDNPPDAGLDGAPGAPTRAIETVPAAAAANSDAIAQLTRRMNMLVGLLALLLVGAFVVIGLLIGRVASAESDATAARSELASFAADDMVSAAELATIRDDLARVEAGAALYASQITGFQEQLVELEPQISAGVEEAIAGLREFGDSTIAFDVNIDEVIPIDTEVVLQRTVAVPIKTEIPINQEFDTTIRVSTPLGAIPLDITVPIDVLVPVDLVVDIPIDETIPFRDEFPVRLDVPIAIDVGDTELKNLTDSLAAGLESLQDVLTGLGG